MHYRLFLMRDGKVRAGQSFSADSDLEARENGCLMADATSDAFEHHEVWQGSRFVASGEVGRISAMSLRTLTEMRQRNLIELETALRDSFQCVASSRKLLASLTELQGLVERKAPPEKPAS